MTTTDLTGTYRDGAGDTVTISTTLDPRGGLWHATYADGLKMYVPETAIARWTRVDPPVPAGSHAKPHHTDAQPDTGTDGPPAAAEAAASAFPTLADAGWVNSGQPDGTPTDSPDLTTEERLLRLEEDAALTFRAEKVNLNESFHLARARNAIAKLEKRAKRDRRRVRELDRMLGDVLERLEILEPAENDLPARADLIETNRAPTTDDRPVPLATVPADLIDKLKTAYERSTPPGTFLSPLGLVAREVCDAARHHRG